MLYKQLRSFVSEAILNNSCFLEAKLGFVELLYWSTIEVLIFYCFPYRLSYCCIFGKYHSYIVYFIAFLFQNHACLSVTSHASVYLDLCQRGNLLNKIVNHLEFTCFHRFLPVRASGESKLYNNVLQYYNKCCGCFSNSHLNTCLAPLMCVITVGSQQKPCRTTSSLTPN